MFLPVTECSEKKLMKYLENRRPDLYRKIDGY